jgi:hypothetical protein
MRPLGLSEQSECGKLGLDPTTARGAAWVAVSDEFGGGPAREVRPRPEGAAVGVRSPQLGQEALGCFSPKLENL